MGNNEHVIIVGAGVAGLASAYYLCEAGFRVTVIDKAEGKNNCSYGNAGMIVPSHIVPLASPGVISQGLRWMLKAESPFSIKPRFSKELLSWGWKFMQASTQKHVEESGPVLRDLLLRNRSLLVELEKKESLDVGFHQNGLFNLCKTEKGLEEEAETVEKAKALGIPAEILSAKETREMEPNIKMDIIGSTYFPMDAHLHPGSLMKQLKKVLKKRGVRFVFNAEVIHLKTHASADSVEIITANNQKFKGSKVILCAGIWTTDLAKKMNLSLPMQAGKGYSITLPNPKHVPQICALLAEAKVSMTPMMGALRFGGTMEIMGKDQSITQAKLLALKKSVTHYFPEYSTADLNRPEVWVGLRPCSPDGLPYVGKVKDVDHVFISTGHAMMGMSLSFASGQLLAQTITEGRAELSHPLIDPNRYS